MSITPIQAQRFSITSSKTFESIVAKLEGSIAHPDVKIFTQDMAAATSFVELERVVQKAVDPFGMMEFVRFNIGEVLRKERGPGSARILRVVIGNPLIMKEMVKLVPDAASYAPVTILIDERPDGVHLSYDKMAAYLTVYGNAEAIKIAKELDSKIEALLSTIA